MLLSIVVSLYNEEENIPELVRRVDAAIASMDGVSHEIIFVNDDSTDRSLEILQTLQERHPITIINMSRRFGYTPCVLAGFAHARGDAVVYMDADLQDPPEIIPQMVRKFQEGVEVVHTTRTSREGESAVKVWATKRAYSLINCFSNIELPENTGDFKLLSRKVVGEILNLAEHDPYLRGLSVWVGYRQDFILYQRQTRFAGHTKFPLFGKGPAREFIRGLTTFSAAPLYLSFFLGIAATLFAAALILYAIVTKLAGIAAPGASGVLIAVALFSGIVLITQGVMGLYVARIYEQVKGRPRYIIKNVIGPRGS